MTTTLDDESFFQQSFTGLFRPLIEEEILTRRLTGLDSAPRCQQISSTKYNVRLQSGIEIKVDSADISPETITEGFAILYGYGFIASNYSLPIFREISSQYLQTCKELALEIWDKCIHIDWMRNFRRHATHNESKTLEVLRRFANGELDDGKYMHRYACDSGKDTPHHVNFKEFLHHLNDKWKPLI